MQLTNTHFHFIRFGSSLHNGDGTLLPYRSFVALTSNYISLDNVTNDMAITKMDWATKPYEVILCIGWHMSHAKVATTQTTMDVGG